MGAIPMPPMSTLDTRSSPAQGFAAGKGPSMGASPGGSQRASAVPGVDTLESITPMKHQGRGLLRIVDNNELDAVDKHSKSLAKMPEEAMTELAGYIRTRFEKAVRHRRIIQIDDELIRDMRAYNGQYDLTKMQEIRKFGGSTVYSRQ